ncbi:aminotransferase class V-fold PLP-dependent enzyme [Streptomyces sp. HYC2]|uniref:aminotransferase class V-fold PLP-dependent enzyme n=1 Tax=Streptomyces sp. HYC2 TaxID=2955207 RepID=UPI0024813FEF|nr:aminotransferase class V-fold PLP-dependent enzyme [Streptomyces sp. HYC2]
MDELLSWHRELRAQFPILTAHPELAYLDSAATAQKPQAVLDAVHAYLTTANANAGRGTYPWANRTTELVEHTRQLVKEFLHDPEPERSTVRFTSGTTEGLRAIARDWLPAFLADGDAVLLPHADHQANLSPWLETCELLARQGVRVEVVQMPYQASSGDYDHRALARIAAGHRIRFAAVTHVHHIYGGDMHVHRVREALSPDAVICLDAAQSVGHLPVSPTALDVDFAVFSGHKAMALPGTGAVWARQARGPAFRPGGWAGTPNTAGIASLTAALEWLGAAGVDRIERWTMELAARLTEGLRGLDTYQVLGCQQSLAADTAVQQRQGIVSFRHREIPPGDLGFILYDRGFMVRSDSHCQAGGGERTASVRVSLHAYSAPEEIDRLLDALTSLA